MQFTRVDTNGMLNSVLIYASPLDIEIDLIIFTIIRGVQIDSRHEAQKPQTRKNQYRSCFSEHLAAGLNWVECPVRSTVRSTGSRVQSIEFHEVSKI